MAKISIKMKLKKITLKKETMSNNDKYFNQSEIRKKQITLKKNYDKNVNQNGI